MNIIIIAFYFLPCVAFILVLIWCSGSSILPNALLACLLGLCSIIPITILQTSIVHFQKQIINIPQTTIIIFIQQLVLCGITEEGIKFCFISILYKKRMRETVFIALAALLGLMMASFESLVYIIKGNGNFFIRFFSAQLLHTLTTTSLAISIISKKKHLSYFSIIISVILVHTMYNFFCLMTGHIKMFSILTIILLALKCREWYTKTTNIQDKI